MKAELQTEEVLAMYDVRGIQKFIFKTNVAKEIIGASKLVDQIITQGIISYLEKNVPEEQKNKYLTDWEKDDPAAFLDQDEIQMQILFIGGGNAYVLFRKGEICQKVNRYLAKYLLEETYSLNLAVAVVKKTDSYAYDYNAIQEEMRRIKAAMPMTEPMGAMPFMAVDSITGYPLTSKVKGDYYCTEAKKKRDRFPKDESEKVFDNMVTEKGDNSTLAVCHIDGNSMGIRICKEMEQKKEYKDAVSCMRNLSLEIAQVFRRTFDQMAKYMDELTPKVKASVKTHLYREIIVAGDDITFVCNAKLAIPAVRYFLENLGNEKDYSACGGIAFFNSHFPFSDAYQVAEACCDNAKKRAKEPENRGNDNAIGNFFDFQICTNVRAANLDSYREKHYVSGTDCFIARPYYVVPKTDRHGLDAVNEKYSVAHLDEWSEQFGKTKIPRSKAKQLRNAIPVKNKREEVVSFLASRAYPVFKERSEEYALWYDALEIMDFNIELEDTTVQAQS